MPCRSPAEAGGAGDGPDPAPGRLSNSGLREPAPLAQNAGLAPTLAVDESRLPKCYSSRRRNPPDMDLMYQVDENTPFNRRFYSATPGGRWRRTATNDSLSPTGPTGGEG